MLRLFLIAPFFYFFLVSASVSAEFSVDAMRANAQVLNLHASSQVIQARNALRSIARLMKRVDLTEKEAHQLFGDFLRDLSGVRAIIYADREGLLKYDSFSLPVPPVNLGSRVYFKDTIAMEENEIYVGLPVLGKTSSIPFIPISIPFKKNGVVQGVLAAVLTPNSLVVNNNPKNCLHCVSIVTDLEGNILAQNPGGFELSKNFRTELNASMLEVQGYRRIRVGLLEGQIYWFRSPKTPIISIFLEFIRD